MNRKFREIAYQMTRKRLDEEEIDAERVSVKEADISFFNLSTNSIISFHRDGKTFFFRECQKIFPRNEFFEVAISRFFGSLKRLEVNKEIFSQEIPFDLNFSDEICSEFGKYIDCKKSKGNFYAQLAKTDSISENCGFSIWENTSYDRSFFRRFGFGDIKEELKNLAIYFLWCMRSAAIAYKTLYLARSKKYSFFCAVRSVCSRIVAEELGVTHLISDAKWCLLDIEGDVRFGVLSSAAPGKRMVDSSAVPNGTLQRELLLLNAIDVICMQPDHGPNNYNIYRNGENAYSVCAFDNDNPRTFFPFPKISDSLAGCSPFVRKDGMINRPFFDSEFTENIKKVNIKKLKRNLHPYLNSLQIFALTTRLSALKEAIAKTVIANPNFLLQVEDWNDYTVRKELSGEYGVTYLVKAMKSGRED